jgi:DNA-binding response OmpR family regulator
MRVLVADDDPLFAHMIGRVAQREHLEPILTSDGLTAACILEGRNAPRIAVLDWLMPGLDGIEICRRIRQSNPYFHTYIILITGKRTGEVIEALDSGADDYILKPFDVDELGARLRLGVRQITLYDRLTSQVHTTHARLQNLPVPVLHLSQTGHLLEANPAAAALFGHHSSTEMLLNDELLREIRQCPGIMHSLMTAQRVDDLCVEWHQADATPVKLLLTGRPIFDPEGRFSSFQLTVHPHHNGYSNGNGDGNGNADGQSNATDDANGNNPGNENGNGNGVNIATDNGNHPISPLW